MVQLTLRIDDLMRPARRLGDRRGETDEPGLAHPPSSSYRARPDAIGTVPGSSDRSEGDGDVVDVVTTLITGRTIELDIRVDTQYTVRWLSGPAVQIGTKASVMPFSGS